MAKNSFIGSNLVITDYELSARQVRAITLASCREPTGTPSRKHLDILLFLAQSGGSVLAAARATSSSVEQVLKAIAHIGEIENRQRLEDNLRRKHF